jgi:hypothetical protein
MVVAAFGHKIFYYRQQIKKLKRNISKNGASCAASVVMNEQLIWLFYEKGFDEFFPSKQPILPPN